MTPRTYLTVAAFRWEEGTLGRLVVGRLVAGSLVGAVGNPLHNSVGQSHEEKDYDYSYSAMHTSKFLLWGGGAVGL